MQVASSDFSTSIQTLQAHTSKSLVSSIAKGVVDEEEQKQMEEEQTEKE